MVFKGPLVHVDDLELLYFMGAHAEDVQERVQVLVPVFVVDSEAEALEMADVS